MDKEEAKLNKVEEEVGIKKNSPALPPNYVSIAQLKERWLQRKQQEVERQKAQAESKNQDDIKPRKGFSETPQNRNNRDPRSEGHHVSDHQVYSRKGNDFDGFAGDDGMDKNVNVREIGEGDYKKKMHGFQKGRKGGGKEHGFWKIKEEKDCSRTQGENRYCNVGVGGTASVFMVEAVCESVGEEVKPVELIRKSDGKMVKDRENLRKNGDGRVKRSGRKSKVEKLTENAMKKEDLGVLRGKNAPLNGDDDDCIVEVLLENKVKEGALLGSGRSKGSERFGGEIERKGKKKIQAKKSSDSEDKNTLAETMEKGMEDEVLTGSNGNSLQKGKGRRKVQGYRHWESVSEDLETETGITGNLRGLSFVDSKKSYVTSRMGGRGNYKKYTRYSVMQKPTDNRCVWVKKGEISATDVAEIDNSGPSKVESTGMDEHQTEREKEAESAD